MKKLLTSLLTVVAASAMTPSTMAEIWTPCGEATWQEGIFNIMTSWWDGEKWSVTVERSSDNPKRYRMQPYVSGKPKPSRWSNSNVYVYIDTTDPSRVYIDNFRYTYDVSQRCPESGWDSAYYGSISNDVITFPVGSFSVGSSYISNKEHKITFPAGLLESVPPQPTWVSIGEGKWLDACLYKSPEPEAWPGEWRVEFEKCVESPDLYRVRPWASADAQEYLSQPQNEAYKNATVIIHTENPNQVYLDPFNFGDIYTFSQEVRENGWDNNHYGTIDEGRIVIPEGAFKLKNSEGIWESSNDGYRDLVITLPEGYLDTPSASGIYLGLTAFNYRAECMPITLLSTKNKADYKNFVNQREDSPETWLFYATDLAMNNIKERTYPEDLGSVAMITFTDGLDDGSLAAADPSWDDAYYQNYLHNRILGMDVQGQKLDAYAIGLKGEDIGDYNYDAFIGTLRNLSSKDENASDVNDMSEVETKMNEIIDNLEHSWINKRIRLLINMRATGDRVRFTFDKSREELELNPENSEIWIEGTFSRNDMSLNDVEYHGLTSTSGSKVVSEVGLKEKRQFTFENLRDLEGNEFQPGKIEYWHRSASTGSTWQPHKEFDQKDDAIPETKRSSAALMFVLDCSTSLGNDFGELKRVVNTLIDRLAPGDDSGIMAPEADKTEEMTDAEGPVEYYNLQGMRVENPTSGLYIRRQGGKATKVLIK